MGKPSNTTHMKCTKAHDDATCTVDPKLPAKRSNVNPRRPVVGFAQACAGVAVTTGVFCIDCFTKEAADILVDSWLYAFEAGSVIVLMVLGYLLFNTGGVPVAKRVEKPAKTQTRQPQEVPTLDAELLNLMNYKPPAVEQELQSILMTLYKTADAEMLALLDGATASMKDAFADGLKPLRIELKDRIDAAFNSPEVELQNVEDLIEMGLDPTEAVLQHVVDEALNPLELELEDMVDQAYYEELESALS
eukprot:gnl/TRDRNA2_/TRDRNA2_75609_c0_seq1.p1 gnl/TRDRNA2_/TRDRNA2_75609_c0~~gnl/TRDRNA2_/TRDRNA2_75609_c0_seq1.p1  ORF type:complete len:248 (+),score=74.43 gnl/TRDRNA2_/TRDRNA2_75609_c0_seq1:76-819(+)